MPGAVGVLAVPVLLWAMTSPAASPAPTGGAEALATRLLAAPEDRRAELLDRDEFASVDVARVLIAAGNSSTAARSTSWSGASAGAS